MPLILLGPRTAVKPDSQTAADELVYSKHLRLSGELIIKPNETLLYPDSFVDILRLERSHVTFPSPRQSTHVT